MMWAQANWKVRTWRVLVCPAAVVALIAAALFMAFAELDRYVEMRLR